MEKFKKILPALLGIILIGAGVFFYFRAGELTKVCTEKTTATVVSMREDFTSDTSTEGMRYIYYPVIEYQAAGETVKGELPSGGNPPAYSINDQVIILYNPNKTSEFIVEGENQNITWIILGGIGIVLLGAGIYTILKK